MADDADAPVVPINEKPAKSKTKGSPARRVEVAVEDEVTVAFEGKDYIFPVDMQDTPGEFLEVFEQGQLAAGLRIILGPAQWAKFKATQPKTRAYKALYNAYFEAIGLPPLGE